MNKWHTASFGDLTNNFDAIRIPVKETDRQSGPYPYYGASGVVDYTDKFIFDGEYLLIAEDGENLRTRNTPIAFIVNGKFWVNNHAHIVSGNDKADTRFLLYAFLSLDIGSYLTGSTMPKLTQGNLKNIQLLTPPLPEQRRIAHILGTLDDKIENNRKTAKTLEAMAQAIFKSWFVDFDPVRAKMAGESEESICKRLKLTPEILDLFPDRLVDSEVGEIPEGWRVGTFGDYADIVGGSTPSTNNSAYWLSGIHSWATPKDLSGLTMPVLLATENKITDAGLHQVSSRLLPVGTVLLSSRAPIGYLAIAEIPVAINQGFIALKPHNHEYCIFLLLLIKHNMEEIISRANGSTFLEISKAKFRPIPVVFPAQGILQSFAKLAMPLFLRIVSLEKITRLLAVQRDTLLPPLISGEIRIPEAQHLIQATTERTP
ncbi:restriction endonuclease subunit S [Acidithiobacillus ferriphilus]|uniref:restriction endonuclease subunit S n=1 Tax=Acidithiobacillus ferriphilus TaxID=1689834 RepID=UPI001C06C987|nr:restriction endonuclease subunit S [Acidithiobacillus ferriphilus]MBU2831867.1 restriction endonuclease subunit S [Acidithiobacillus ferriphilus]